MSFRFAAMRALALTGISAGAIFAAVSPAHADTISGTCVDGEYFDGLNTEFGATFCASALTTAGYSANKLRNTAAPSVLGNLATDAVFYHAGHALVNASGTAVASVMPKMPPITGLQGAPLSIVNNEGPLFELCNEDKSHCIQGTFEFYPYNTEMAKFNLAVFQSCRSARDTTAASLMTSAYNYEAGTAIGFDNNVSWFDDTSLRMGGAEFARTFWNDVGTQARTYGASLVDAANAAGGYGYSSYEMLHHDDAPNRLAPAKYYLP